MVFPAKRRNGAKAEVVIWMEGSSLCSAAAVGDSRTKARDGSKTGRISFGGTASGERERGGGIPSMIFPWLPI